MLKDFKAFLLRGNVVDLAIAVVIGAAFGTVTTSFVTNIITPLISIPGKTNFGDLNFKVRNSVFAYGAFLNALFSFLLIAAAVYFLVVRPVNALMARRKTEPDVTSPTTECLYCLSNIPVAAAVCAFCTREAEPQ